MKINIYVVAHKKFETPKIKGYYPIAVGPNKELFNNKLSDNLAVSISEKNANYCELTALYAIMNNLESDVIGLCHYRRYFYKNFKSLEYDNIITENIIEDTLNEYDIILPLKNISRLTIREEYAADGSGLDTDIDILRGVVKDLYPDYLSYFDNVFNGHESYLYNMFISTYKIAKQYSEWLFNILFEVESRVDLKGYSKQQLRIFGYMSERLLTIYVLKNKLKIKEMVTMNNELSLKKNQFREIKRRLKKIM